MKPIIILVIVFASISCGNLKASSFYYHSDIDSVYAEENVDIKPVPEKGMKEVYKSVAKTFIYPIEVRDHGFKGEVFIALVINEKGELTDVAIAKGMVDCIDTAALKAFRKVKVKWIPGVKNSKNVTTRIVIPFKLNLA